MTEIAVPQRTLLVLCGSAGSGKSTYARTLAGQLGLPGTAIVSSDVCRSLVCDDAANQTATRAAFTLFHQVIALRMAFERPTIADSTALTPSARQELLDLARDQEYTPVLLLIDTPLFLCQLYNRKRERQVPAGVLAQHAREFEQATIASIAEGWTHRLLVNPRTATRPAVTLI